MSFCTTRRIFPGLQLGIQSNSSDAMGSRKLWREIQDSLYWTCEFNSLASALALGVNPWSMMRVRIPVIGQAVTSVRH